MTINKPLLIRSFAIKGLFGTTDVQLSFQDDTTILIGENGLGKTQILNIFYYTLAQRFDKLAQYSFDSIALELGDEKVEFNKVLVDIMKQYSPSVRRVLKTIGVSNFIALLKGDPGSSVFRSISKEFSIPGEELFYIRREVGTIREPESLIFNNVSKGKEVLNDFLQNHQILYFPTYRRVEEDLHNLGYKEENFQAKSNDDRLIHFGMQDVDKQFKALTQKIEKLSTDGLAKISGEILSQLVKGIPDIDTDFLNNIKQKDIDIVLARVGNQISTEDKIRIKNIVATKAIQPKDYPMLFFLQKLIAIYDEQRELDRTIKVFRDICNKYLVNKELIYDESHIDIYIQVKDSNEKVPLRNLSSGEKQIISIFSKIYLSPAHHRFIVLFDEPELSLSIFWQRELLPDIVRSGKCAFLLAVTHSPFIFENELDQYAVSLGAYLTPSKTLQPV